MYTCGKCHETVIGAGDCPRCYPSEKTNKETKPPAANLTIEEIQAHAQLKIECYHVSITHEEEILESHISFLIDKVAELRNNIAENGNNAQKIMAKEVLDMREKTARECAGIAVEERVSDTGIESDAAYNVACVHVRDAIFGHFNL
jgi:uncharacterized protein (UPF0305 family)